MRIPRESQDVCSRTLACQNKLFWLIVNLNIKIPNFLLMLAFGKRTEVKDLFLILKLCNCW